MYISQKIVETIESSLDLLCACKEERAVQNILGNQLDCQVRYTLSSDTYPNVEVDLLGENYAIEVKFNKLYYDGISQVLILKYLYKINTVILLHIHKYLDSKFTNAFEELAKKLDFIGILINQRKKSLEVVHQDEGI
ncbi:MAG: hypothetical protein ACE5R6_21115 [Candidatus Heimdallarchaeota archaeon]